MATFQFIETQIASAEEPQQNDNQVTTTSIKEYTEKLMNDIARQF